MSEQQEEEKSEAPKLSEESEYEGGDERIETSISTDEDEREDL